MSEFEYYVDADKIRVMRTPKGSTYGNDQRVVALCATDAGGMDVAIRIAEMLNGSSAGAPSTSPCGNSQRDALANAELVLTGFIRKGMHLEERTAEEMSALVDAHPTIKNIRDALAEPAQEQGWCTRCGCGNDRHGFAHAPLCPTRHLTQEMRRLIIAARVVAFQDQGADAIKELDEASEAFADQVEWDDEPVAPPARSAASTVEPAGRIPTEAMIAEGVRVRNNGAGVSDIWTAMFDVALSRPAHGGCDRTAVIEECAKVLDDAAQDWNRIRDPGMANNARSYAKTIRALARNDRKGGAA